MSEKIPSPKLMKAVRTAEEIQSEENERYGYEKWKAEHPINETRQDSPEMCTLGVAMCEGLLSRFEQTYDLEALRAITHFSSKEERESSIRQPALKALTPMFQLIRHLRTQKAVKKEALKVLQARYTVISNAVGNVTGDPNGKIFDVVVHNRAIWP
jgi:predicted RNA-binding protein associated with RNAse of E/G family